MAKQVLMVSPIDPADHNTGEGERIRNLIKPLNTSPFNLELLHGDSDSSDRPIGFPTIISRYLYDVNPFLYYQLIRTMLRSDYDAIQVEGPRGVVASKLVAKILSSENTPRIILDCHNFETGDAFRDRSENLHWLKRRLAPYIIMLFEWISVRFADHIFTVSEDDKNKFIKAYNIADEEVTVIPSGAEAPDCNVNPKLVREEWDLPQEAIIAVFHGTYSYIPNEEAVSFLRDHIAPDFRDEDVHFAIAGQGVPEFSDENVHGVGFVDDLYSFLMACNIAVVPLQTGGGTKLKMFDYMACSLPIITTPQGAEGINLSHDENALIVENPKKITEHIRILSSDHEKRDKLGNQANILFQEKYTWETISEKIRSFYND